MQPQQVHVQPFGPPVRLRANPGASVLAGLLALLAAGLLVWFAVANMEAFEEPWPSVVTVNVIGGFVAAGWLVIAAMFTFARTVAGAWALGVSSLFFVIMNIVAPLLRGESFSAQMDFLFGFHKATGVGAGLFTIVSALTAIVAVVAATARRP